MIVSIWTPPNYPINPHFTMLIVIANHELTLQIQPVGQNVLMISVQNDSRKPVNIGCQDAIAVHLNVTNQNHPSPMTPTIPVIEQHQERPNVAKLMWGYITNSQSEGSHR